MASISLNGTTGGPIGVAETKSSQPDSPVTMTDTCSSQNCINKKQENVEEQEEKKGKKKNKKQKKPKEESDSDSSDSDNSSSSSDSRASTEDSSDSDSTSEGAAEPRKSKKTKLRVKKVAKKTKVEKDKPKPPRMKNKKSRRTKVEDEDHSDDSEDNSSDSSSTGELSDLKKELEAKGLFKKSKTKAALKELFKLASKRNENDDDTKSENSDTSERDSKPRKSRSDRSDKKTRKDKKDKKDKSKEKAPERDSSKPKYKRIDEIWNELLYDYQLRETTDKEVTDEFDKYVFTVRRKFDVENHYQSTIVDIKSSHLKDCLKVVLDGVQGVSLVEKTPRLAPDLLFMYLEDFREYGKILDAARKKHKDKAVKKSLKTKSKHLELLIGYIDKDYDETKKTLYPMLKNGTITFDLLWTLYKPNTLAYKAMYGDENQPRAFKIEFATKERDYTRGFYYDVEGKYLDYDGDKFGWAFMDAEVLQFQGARKITSLSCYPLQYHQKEAALRKQLLERGKKFLTLAGMHYKRCEGTCYVKKDNKVLKVNVNGRVMIDPKTFRRINPNYPLCEIQPRDVEDGNEECQCEKPDQPKVPKPNQDRLFMIEKKDEDKISVAELALTDPRAPDNSTDPVKKSEAAKMTFTQEELLLTSPLLPGFSFGEKLWIELAVSNICEVQWNAGAFDSLVIPEKHKSIVKALVSSHRQHASRSIDDVVSGKGKGLVAVLHGKPGLGKTLTCEAVSDLLKRPLYAVSAGDLGTNATSLEFQLQTILDVAHTWGAVLLLDEADVFLEERSSRDVHRNAMVSIFLRLLEYHEGILFLTTNRVETFDEAFVSRIHLSLRYGELTVQARRAIWKTFIAKVADSATTSEPSGEASGASTTAMPTPDATSSTPNSGSATPAPSQDNSTEPPATPVSSSSSSITSADSGKTITLPASAELESTSEDISHSAGQDSVSTTAVDNITEANYAELSRIDLNGRQIKNLVKTAQALALHEGVPMGMGHLRRCIEVGRSFELDLKGGRGWEDVMRSYT